jgi:tRNA threonylcarbamoyladenosine modification (KEOPS) complex  Pcc1 subunit
MHRALVTVESRKSDVVYNSIKQEAAPRVNVRISSNGDVVEIEILSENSSNLRAALNSFLKWIDMVDRIGDVVNANPLKG